MLPTERAHPKRPPVAIQLSDFIQKHRNKIVEEWIAFASTLRPWAKGLREMNSDKKGEMTTRTSLHPNGINNLRSVRY